MPAKVSVLCPWCGKRFDRARAAATPDHRILCPGCNHPVAQASAPVVKPGPEPAPARYAGHAWLIAVGGLSVLAGIVGALAGVEAAALQSAWLTGLGAFAGAHIVYKLEQIRVAQKGGRP